MSNVPPLDQQKPLFSTPCHAATIGLGITLLAGSIFLALAAHRIFPCKANLLSRLSLPVRITVYGGAALLGSILSIVGLYLLHREAQIRAGASKQEERPADPIKNAAQEHQVDVPNVTEETLKELYEKHGMDFSELTRASIESLVRGLRNFTRHSGLDLNDLEVVDRGWETSTFPTIFSVGYGHNQYLWKVKATLCAGEPIVPGCAISLNSIPSESWMSPEYAVMLIGTQDGKEWIQLTPHQVGDSDFWEGHPVPLFFWSKPTDKNRDSNALNFGVAIIDKSQDARVVENAMALKAVLKGEEEATLTDHDGTKWRLHRPIKEC